jgi:NAD(P)-dependent dehydrogenase (short-subunit alcohol dehydrogenase family)
MINDEGKGAAIAYTADITHEDACKAIVEKAMETYGRLDILVNNVGIMGPRGTAPEVDMAEWEVGMRVNVSSMVMMAKYAIPEMRKNQGQWRGAIVNLGSVAGLRGGTPSLLYPTSKGAVVNLTVSWDGSPQYFFGVELILGHRGPWHLTTRRMGSA